MKNMLLEYYKDREKIISFHKKKIEPNIISPKQKLHEKKQKKKNSRQKLPNSKKNPQTKFHKTKFPPKKKCPRKKLSEKYKKMFSDKREFKKQTSPKNKILKNYFETNISQISILPKKVSFLEKKIFTTRYLKKKL